MGSARRILVATIPFLVLLAALPVEPLPQPLSYHLFADRRSYLGLPNFGDVASNFAFLLAGVAGLFYCARYKPPGALRAWVVHFAGLVLVFFGSAYYHLAPDNETLVWDRLAMSVAFMGIYIALLADYVDRRLERSLHVAVVLGLASVVYWSQTDDLRIYLSLQAIVFGSIVVILTAFKNEYREKTYLGAAIVSYVAALACEQLDDEIFALTGSAISGHTAKHLFAGLSAFWILLMLRARNAVRDSSRAATKSVTMAT